MDVYAKRQTNSFSWVCFGILVILAQLLGLTAVVLMAVWMGHFRGGLDWENKRFNYHPLFMVIGLVYLYSQSMLFYRMVRNGRKSCVKIIHGSLFIAAFIFAVLGLVAVVGGRKFKPYSLHAWMGLATVSLFGLQWIGGFLMFLWPGAPLVIRTLFKPIHTYFGPAVFCMAIATCLMGTVEKTLFSIMNTYGTFPPEGLLINFLGLTFVALAFVVVYILTREEYKRPLESDEEYIGLKE